MNSHKLRTNNILIPCYYCSYLASDAAPRFVRATVQSSSDIFVQWNRLQPCRDVNGNITHYQVQYQAQPTETNCKDANVDLSIRSELVPGVFDRNGNATLTGLSYFTNYSIRVAAVNEEGDVGVYSEPIFEMTLEHSETSGVCCSL